MHVQLHPSITNSPSSLLIVMLDQTTTLVGYWYNNCSVIRKLRSCGSGLFWYVDTICDYYITYTPTRRPNILDDLWTELLWFRLYCYHEWLLFLFLLPQQHLYWSAHYMLILFLGLFLSIISLHSCTHVILSSMWVVMGLCLG